MKLIKMPENLKTQALKDFDQQYKEARKRFTQSNRVTEKFEFKFEPPTDLTVPENIKKDLVMPRIIMTAGTYLKMLEYVLKIDIECVWHGFVTRHENNVFAINDVMMYPHEGSPTYVESDDTLLYNKTITVNGKEYNYPEIKKYNFWRESLTPEQELSLRFQAHSHVNMGVGPSGTDINDQKNLMNIITDYMEANPKATPQELAAINPYYIFAIMNKRQEINWFIFDYASGIFFEKEDITFSIIWKEDYTMETLEEEIAENHKRKYEQNRGFQSYGDYENTYGYSYNSWERNDRTNKSCDEIWEIQCTSIAAKQKFQDSWFYKTNKENLIMKDSYGCFYFYPKNKNTNKQVNFDIFKHSEAYKCMQGVICREIRTPNWFSEQPKQPVVANKIKVPYFCAYSVWK